MENVIDFDGYKIAPYLVNALEGFINDPPDSPFQRGYLAALIAVYKEGLGKGTDDIRLAVVEKL